MVLTPRTIPPPPTASIDEVIERALEEDQGSGDVTSLGLVPEHARAVARLVGRADGVLAGLDVFARVFLRCDPHAEVAAASADGEPVTHGAELMRVTGNARALLLAERTALNLLQRLSGVATLTARYVALVADSPGVRLLDTRKTTPGLRHLEKYAVRCGGGDNHRIGLFDQAMIKENHLALAGCEAEDAVRRLREHIGNEMILTAEASNASEAEAAVRGGADVVLLDNMSPAQMAELAPGLRALAEGRGRAVELEASGGITEDTLAEVARSGVDRISIGALTHSAPALDLSLYLDPLPESQA